MPSNPQIGLAVIVVAVITYICRAAPFVLLRRKQDAPLLTFLPRAMPLGVMVVLIAYTVGEVGPAPSSWLPPLVGIGTTAGLHLWRGSMALSLVGGTAAYVAVGLLL